MRVRPRVMVFSTLLGVGSFHHSVAQQEAQALGPLSIPSTLSKEQARPALDNAIGYLLNTQNQDGSWASAVKETLWFDFAETETYYAWKMAASALVVRALLVAPETPERRKALEHGLRWLCTARVPKRPGDWDTDYVWTALCGIDAMVDAARDPRFQESPWSERIRARGRVFHELLVQNQVPNGGWGYYDDLEAPYTRRPKWATSFCTAMVLPALQAALELGWSSDRTVLPRAQDAVRRCALPNGAYTYTVDTASRFRAGESIDDIRGSLGRTQVAHWGLAVTGDRRIGQDRLRTGLDQFFEHHRFLDVARMRPDVHEAYYDNSGYFYLFGHVYAAEVIELLPERDRESLHARLRPHLVKVQRQDGSARDFLNTTKFTAAGTAMTAYALAVGLHP